MYCSKCGATNPDDSIFCVNCGEKLLLDSASEDLQKTENKESDKKLTSGLMDEADKGKQQRSSIKRPSLSLKEFEINGEIYNVTKVAERLFFGKKDEALFELELLTGLDAETCNGFIPEIQKLISTLEKNYKEYPINGSLYNVEKVLDLLNGGDALSAYESLKLMGIEEDIAKITVTKLMGELETFRRQQKDYGREIKEKVKEIKESEAISKVKDIKNSYMEDAFNSEDISSTDDVKRKIFIKKIVPCILIVFALILLIMFNWAELNSTTKRIIQALTKGYEQQLKEQESNPYFALFGDVVDKTTAYIMMFNDGGLTVGELIQYAKVQDLLGEVADVTGNGESITDYFDELESTTPLGYINFYKTIVTILFIFAIIAGIATIIIRFSNKLSKYKKYDVIFFFLQMAILILTIILLALLNHGADNTLNQTGLNSMNLTVWAILSVILSCPSLVLNKISIFKGIIPSIETNQLSYKKKRVKQ